jgi:hypothetical protein
MSRRNANDTTATAAPVARLLTIRQVAARLALSYWGARDLVNRGHLPSVRLPGKQGSELRRLLVDERDLEAFIGAHRELRRAS